MNEIVPGLYVGDAHDARSLPSYIKRVVNCAAELGNIAKLDTASYHHIPLIDDDTFEDTLYFYQSIPGFLRFVDQLPIADHPVFVHCAMGVSRSCSMAVAYILHQRVQRGDDIQSEGKMALDAAYELVMGKRPQAFCGGEWKIYQNALYDYFM